MSIASGKSISLEANGLGAWIPLAAWNPKNPGMNRIEIKSTNWNGSSVAVKFNSEDSTNHCPVESSAGAITVTSNKVIDLNGPGYVTGLMSTYGGTAVTIKVLDNATRFTNGNIGV